MWRQVFVFVSIFIFASCAKREPQTPALGTDYYPVYQGRYVEYQVDSVVYTEIPRDTTAFSYRIREKLSGTFNDNEGKSSWRLERYIKRAMPGVSYDSVAWQIKEVWSVTAGSVAVQVNEGNIRYTKLAFPVSQGMEWNGNAFNNLGERTFRYDYVDRSEKVGSNSYANVAKVRERNDSSAIAVQRQVEKYAKGVGLVYREITSVFSNSVLPGVPVERRIVSGVIYKQTAIAFGHD